MVITHKKNKIMIIHIKTPHGYSAILSTIKTVTHLGGEYKTNPTTFSCHIDIFLCLRIMDAQHGSGETINPGIGKQMLCTEDCHEFASQFGLAFFYMRKTPKNYREGRVSRQFLLTECRNLMHTSNVEIHGRFAEHFGKYDTLLEIVKKRMVGWTGHAVTVKGTLANTVLQSRLHGKDHEEGQQDSGWTM